MSDKLKREIFLYTPTEKRSAPVNVWLCHPFNYMYGMSTLSYLSLFKNLDLNKDALPKMIFADTNQASTNQPDLVGFSMLFENDFIGIFKTLEKYNIPIKSCDRKNHPLVFAGGSILTANPEPFADFFDFIIIGDGETIFDKIIETSKSFTNETRQEKLFKHAQIKGVYVPSFYEVEYNRDGTIKCFKSRHCSIAQEVEKITTKNLENCVYTPILSDKAFYPDTFFIEIGRGCPNKCKFCTASYLNFPARYPSFESIKQAIDLGVENAKKIMLIGALISEHPNFTDICEYLIKKRKESEFSIEFTSLKAAEFNSTATKTLLECGQKEVTIAIEAGSQRMRDKISKNLNELQIKNTVKSFAQNGIEKINIFTLIGLPEENSFDIQELARLAADLKKENPNLKINFIVSTFIPKPNTPFQWSQKETTEVLQEKIDFLKERFDSIGVNHSFSRPKRDYINSVLSRGDRRLCSVIEKVYEKKGSLESWASAHNEEIEINQIPSYDWYATRKRDSNEILPWDFIDVGVNKEQLEVELELQSL